MPRSNDLTVRALTPERWDDFVTLMGESGGHGGCWCMWWRCTRAEFEKRAGSGNKRAIKRIVETGGVPGVLGYEGREVVGWCSIAPRSDYDSLERSRVLKRLDETPVWSLVCLFVSKAKRGEGVALDLVKGAVDWARSRGAEAIEAYPYAATGKRLPAVASFMGIPSLFENAGFEEVAAPSEVRRVMRRTFEDETP